MGYRYNALSGVFDIVEELSDTVINLEGDSGGAIGPDGSDIIYVVGDSDQGVSSSGSGNTVTFTVQNASDALKGVASFSSAHFSVSSGAVSLVSSVPLSFPTDSGTATPSANAITIAGGSGINTSASGSTLTIEAVGGESAVDSLIPDSGTSPVVPDGSSQITIAGGTGISTVGGTNTLTINLDTPVATGSGGTGLDTSTAANGNLLIGNGTGLSLATLTEGTSIDITNGAGSITVAFDVTESPAIPTSINADSGTCTPTTNVFSIVGGTGLTTTASGNQISITLDGGTQAIDGLIPDSGTSPVVPDGDGHLTVAGGNGIATVGGTNVVTFNMASPFSGNFTFDATLSADTFDTTNTTTGLTITDNSITADGTDSNISLSLVPKGTGGVIVDTNLTVGSSSQQASFTVNGATITSVISAEAEGTGDLGGLINHRHSSTAGFGPHTLHLRSRGTHASPTVVQSGDALGLVCFAGYDGTDYATAAHIYCHVDGTPGSDDMPARLSFWTSPDSSQTPTEALRVDSSQQISFTQYTQNTLLYVGASGLITEVGPLTNGQLLVGSTSNPPQAATLTEGTSIDITNAAGAITVAFDVTESAAIPTSIVTDSGTCTPTSNSFSIVGAGDVSTSASGNTITIDGTGSGGSGDIVLAYQANQASNVTGNGAVYKLGTSVALTEVFDTGNDFNPGDGAGTPATFTAPSDGKYLFCLNILLLKSSNNCNAGTIQLITSNRTLQHSWGYPEYGGVTNESHRSPSFSAIVDMDASDTAQFSAIATGGGAIVSVGGSNGGPTGEVQTFISIQKVG